MSNLNNHKTHPKKRGQRNESKDAAAAENSNRKEKLVNVSRCAKVVKGGRRFSFGALVVVGDQQGSVGVGQGKAKEVPDAVRKATQRANRDAVTIQRKGTTIPHTVTGQADGSRVLLRPACPGTGIKASGGVRAVLECAGIQDILSKSLGSNTPGSVVKATIDALSQLRSAEEIQRIRQSVQVA